MAFHGFRQEISPLLVSHKIMSGSVEDININVVISHYDNMTLLYNIKVTQLFQVLNLPMSRAV